MNKDINQNQSQNNQNGQSDQSDPGKAVVPSDQANQNRPVQQQNSGNPNLPQRRPAPPGAPVKANPRSPVAAKPVKNADMSDYRHATGLEALFGYLYVTERMGRIDELFKFCVDFIKPV